MANSLGKLISSCIRTKNINLLRNQSADYFNLKLKSSDFADVLRLGADESKEEKLKKETEFPQF